MIKILGERKLSACLAQLVEHLPRKQKAKGSTPLTGFFELQNFQTNCCHSFPKTIMVELEDKSEKFI